MSRLLHILFFITYFSGMSIAQICPGFSQSANKLMEGFSPCENGFAGEYPCSGYDLQSHLTNDDMGGAAGNDCWGWVDPLNGNEYALMGLNNGTAFVDITDPNNPIYLGRLNTHTTNSIWRDIKVYQNHAFIVSEAFNHGMQVFDLTRLRNVVSPPVMFTEDAHFSGFGSSHNFVINEETGFAYQVGGGTFNGGPQFIDISNPTNPQTVGGYDGDGYTHDAQVVSYIGPDQDHQGQEIFFGANENTLTIVDVTDKSDPSLLSRIGYENSVYTHQGWVTEDHKYYLMDDEIDEINLGVNTRTLVWDIQDLDNPFYLGDHLSDIEATDHNLYIKDNLVFQANYKGGLRVLEMTDIENASLNEIGFFDTFPEANSAGYDGAWSNYPFFPSGNIIISDYDRGLFIVKASETTVNVSIKVMLQGPYNEENGMMNDNLREGNYLPLTEPYTAMGYVVNSASVSQSILNQTGSDAIVDWILVELRDASNPSVVVQSKALLLQRDGDVVTVEGSEIIEFNTYNTGSVEIAIRHRNHFGVRTSMSFNVNSALNIDFTNPNTSLYGNNPMIQVGTKLLMVGGDANGDGQVNAVDNTIWRSQFGQAYFYNSSTADFLLNGVVNAIDNNLIWRPNNAKVQQLD